MRRALEWTLSAILRVAFAVMAWTHRRRLVVRAKIRLRVAKLERDRRVGELAATSDAKRAELIYNRVRELDEYTHDLSEALQYANGEFDEAMRKLGVL